MTDRPNKMVDGKIVPLTDAEWQEYRDRQEVGPATAVPSSVTMRQAKLALLRAGLLDEADAAIAGLPGTEGRAAQIEWEYASELRRDHTLVAQLGPALGLDTAAKIDALFIAAAQIA